MHDNGVAPVDLPTLKARVKSLCEQVGFGLARSVTKAVAATEDPEQISNAAVLSALSAKLEDTVRGVERLRTATGVVGQAEFLATLPADESGWRRPGRYSGSQRAAATDRSS